MRTLFSLALLSSMMVAFAGFSYGHMGAKGVVKERMETMKSLATAMKSISKMARGREPLNPDTMIDASKLLAKHGARIVASFPSGTGGGASEASPNIWLEPGEFRKRADALVAASNALRAAARSQDATAIRSAYGSVGRTCSGCHKRFRTKKKQKN